MKYKNKKTGQIGKVVHYKGITTTLRFDDGSEVILTPANVKHDWKEIEDTDVDRITFRQLCENMKDHNRRFDGEKSTLSGIIVYSQDNFTVPYTEEQRSYRVWNSNRMFQSGKISNSLFGDCIDGSDPGVRLDSYDWDIDYCYMENNVCTLS